jgi:hypothetical protein
LNGSKRPAEPRENFAADSFDSGVPATELPSAGGIGCIPRGLDAFWNAITVLAKVRSLKGGPPESFIPSGRATGCAPVCWRTWFYARISRRVLASHRSFGKDTLTKRRTPHELIPSGSAKGFAPVCWRTWFYARIFRRVLASHLWFKKRMLAPI